MIVCGIDPGLTGALAIYGDGCLEQVVDMPTKPTPWGRRRYVDLPAVHSILDAWRPDIVYLEHVWQLPRQSAQSGFSFGGSFFLVLGAIDLSGLAISLVRPQEWTGHFGIPSKRKSPKMAGSIVTRVFPDAPIHGPRGGLKDGRCDAILIALYGASKERNSIN